MPKTNHETNVAENKFLFASARNGSETENTSNQERKAQGASISGTSAINPKPISPKALTIHSIFPEQQAQSAIACEVFRPASWLVRWRAYNHCFELEADRCACAMTTLSSLVSSPLSLPSAARDSASREPTNDFGPMTKTQPHARTQKLVIYSTQYSNKLKRKEALVASSITPP